MQLFRNILVGLVVLVVAAVVVAFMLPRVVTVERGTVIAAPPEKVFVHVNSLRRSNEWSPWYERDPAMEQSFDGPEEGVGAKMSWKSDGPDVGWGRQKIVESVPNELVAGGARLRRHGQRYRGLYPDAGRRRHQGRLGLQDRTRQQPGGALLRPHVRQWIGADYEGGLAKLKVLVESQR
jgi:hypothetical protein